MIDTPNIEINQNALWKKRLRGRISSRMLAVQCLYAIALHDKAKMIEHINIDIDEVINSIMFCAMNTYKKVDKEYFYNLVHGVCKNIVSIDQCIENLLSQNWSLKRLARVVQSILRLAVYEILNNESEAKPFLINEYIEIAKVLNHEGEAGFVNGVLDRILPKGKSQLTL